MRLLRPDMAVWLLAVPVALAGWWMHYLYKWRHRRKDAAGPTTVARSRRTRRGRDMAVLVLAMTSVLLLAGAMMRPQLRTEQAVPVFERRDLILILDRSVSMRARDIRPSRFDRAIDEIQNFLRRKPDTFDRVGLIGFAEQPVVLSYPTDDMESLAFYLDWAREDPTPLFGTNMGEALMSALAAARRDRQPEPPVFVVISDGEDQSGQLRRAVAYVQRARIVVHGIGVGSDDSVPMPLRLDDGREDWLRDLSGQVVRTRFNETTLRELASATSGSYFRSRTGGELLAALDAIAVAERRQSGWTSTVEYRDLYPMLLAGAAAATLALLVLL